MKKILITTQKIDEADDHFVFFLDWIRAFAEHYERVVVITLYKGKAELPPNVSVYSLGKESGPSRLKYLINFFRLIYKLKEDYDDVFVHMNPEYVVLGGLFFKIYKKKIGLWYTHRQVNLKLRIATFFSDHIFTAVRESFLIKTPKLHIIGHGINTSLFSSASNYLKGEDLVITTVSRIVPIKNIETMIKAIEILKNKITKRIVLKIISKIPNDNDKYFLSIKKLIKESSLDKNVEFLGAVPGYDLPKYYAESTLTYNMTPTGGLDKSVLESLATGVPVISTNEALRDLFSPYDKDLIAEHRNYENVALKTLNLLSHDNTLMSRFLQDKVLKNYDFRVLVDKVCSVYKNSDLK